MVSCTERTLALEITPPPDLAQLMHILWWFLFVLYFFILITFSTRPGTVHAHFMMMIFLKLRRSTSLFTCSCQKGFVATGQLLLPNNLVFGKIGRYIKKKILESKQGVPKKLPLELKLLHSLNKKVRFCSNSELGRGPWWWLQKSMVIPPSLMALLTILQLIRAH